MSSRLKRFPGRPLPRGLPSSCFPCCCGSSCGTASPSPDWRLAGFILGLWSVARLPLDIVPDISNVQVQILTAVPNLAVEESEISVTRPLELEMNGLPGLEETRSVTVFGVSQVTLVAGLA